MQFLVKYSKRPKTFEQEYTSEPLTANRFYALTCRKSSREGKIVCYSRHFLRVRGARRIKSFRKSTRSDKSSLNSKLMVILHFRDERSKTRTPPRRGGQRRVQFLSASELIGSKIIERSLDERCSF